MDRHAPRRRTRVVIEARCRSSTTTSSARSCTRCTSSRTGSCFEPLRRLAGPARAADEDVLPARVGRPSTTGSPARARYRRVYVAPPRGGRRRPRARGHAPRDLLRLQPFRLREERRWLREAGVRLTTGRGHEIRERRSRAPRGSTRTTCSASASRTSSSRSPPGSRRTTRACSRCSRRRSRSCSRTAS